MAHNFFPCLSPKSQLAILMNRHNRYLFEYESIQLVSKNGKNLHNLMCHFHKLAQNTTNSIIFHRVCKPFVALPAQPSTLRNKLVIGRPLSKTVSPKPKRKKSNPFCLLMNHCAKTDNWRAEMATALREAFSATVTRIVMMVLMRTLAVMIN